MHGRRQDSVLGEGGGEVKCLFLHPLADAHDGMPCKFARIVNHYNSFKYAAFFLGRRSAATIIHRVEAETVQICEYKHITRSASTYN